MALGLYLSEEVKWSTDGAQLTLGSWEYKPPAAHDIPLQLNVEFEDNIPNPAKLGTLRSKASGEPPMALGGAAYIAVRAAIRAARADAGEHGAFELDAPLTVEHIQQACVVSMDRFRVN